MEQKAYLIFITELNRGIKLSKILSNSNRMMMRRNLIVYYKILDCSFDFFNSMLTLKLSL